MSFFRVAYLLSGGQFSKERICSIRSKLSPLRVDLFLQGLRPPPKQTENYGFVHHCKMAEKHRGIPINVKTTSKRHMTYDAALTRYEDISTLSPR